MVGAGLPRASPWAPVEPPLRGAVCAVRHRSPDRRPLARGGDLVSDVAQRDDHHANPPGVPRALPHRAPPAYSYRSAWIGSRRLARHAGKRPESTPTASDTPNARTAPDHVN